MFHCLLFITLKKEAEFAIFLKWGKMNVTLVVILNVILCSAGNFLANTLLHI
jgi:hypothetical protein